jgi:LAGLIDADG endonuclease
LSTSIQHKYVYDTAKTSLLQIKNYSDIRNKIIPFFNEFSILGVKSLDFNDFKKVASLIDNKEHLTLKGLNQIVGIVKGMNLDRKLDNTV